MRPFLWIALAGSCLFLSLAGFSQSQNGQPKPVPYRSADGKVTGWKVAIPGNRPLASPAIADGKIFVGGGFGSHEFYAFDATTGAHLWTYHTSDDGPTAAVVDDGKIAFNTESCELEVITTSGRPLWKKWLGDPLMSMPAIAQGTVYMAYPDSHGDHGYYVAAFDLKTGSQTWKHAIANEAITAPVIDRDRLYLSTVDGSMLALNRTNGGLIWEEKKNATSAPAVWNEQVYFSRGDETKTQAGGRPATQKTEVLGARAAAPKSEVRDISATRQNADYLDYTKNVNSVKERQNQSLDASVGFAGPNKGSAKMAMATANLGQASVHGVWAYQGSKPFVDKGRLYSSMGENARSVDPSNGKVIWTRQLRRQGKPGSDADTTLTPPAIVNGKVFIGTGAGEIYALSEQTGEILWKVDIGESISFQPTIANGRLYVATNRGTLYCLNTGDWRDHGWLMWGASAAHNGMPSK